MTEYQITSWRDLPSLVVARDGDDVTKIPMPQRFQEAIDEAAMRLGEIDADAYLAGWQRSEWTVADGTPVEVCERVGAELENTWTTEAVADYLTTLG